MKANREWWCRADSLAARCLRRTNSSVPRPCAKGVDVDAAARLSIRGCSGQPLDPVLQCNVHCLHTANSALKNLVSQRSRENPSERFTLNKTRSGAYRLQNESVFSVKDSRKPDVSLPSQFAIRLDGKYLWMKSHRVRACAFNEFDDITLFKLSVQSHDLRIPQWIALGGGENLPYILRWPIDQNFGLDGAVVVHWQYCKQTHDTNAHDAENEALR